MVWLGCVSSLPRTAIATTGSLEDSPLRGEENASATRGLARPAEVVAGVLEEAEPDREVRGGRGPTCQVDPSLSAFSQGR